MKQKELKKLRFQMEKNTACLIGHTVDLVIFARLQFSLISRGRHIREFKNPAKIIIVIALQLSKLIIGLREF